MEAEVVALSHRVAELEATVRVLAVLVGIFAAALVTVAAYAAMWFRWRHVEMMRGIRTVEQGQEELRDELHAAELSRGVRGREQALLH